MKDRHASLSPDKIDKLPRIKENHNIKNIEVIKEL